MKAEKTATRPALFRLQCVIKPISFLNKGHIEASSVLYQHAKRAELNCETDFFRTQEKAYRANSSAIPLIVSILYKLFISELFASKSISVRVQTILTRLFLTLVTLLIHHSRISIHPTTLPRSLRPHATTNISPHGSPACSTMRLTSPSHRPAISRCNHKNSRKQHIIIIFSEKYLVVCVKLCNFAAEILTNRFSRAYSSVG